MSNEQIIPVAIKQMIEAHVFQHGPMEGVVEHILTELLNPPAVEPEPEPIAEEKPKPVVHHVVENHKRKKAK